MRLQGRVAFISGGNDGIGRAIAYRFVKEGAKVVLMARREEKGREVEKELNLLGGNEDCALFVQGDVRKEQDSVFAVSKLIEKYGHLDILVNCAAAQGTSTVLSAKPEDYRHFFDTNIMGYGLCSKAAIPYLLKSENSAIVNVASIVGCIGTANRMLYDITKAAVIQMTKCMACDFPSIRVNSISPGFTMSEAEKVRLAMYDKDPIGLAAKLGSLSLMRRTATPDEQANVVLFLASDDAAYITGENIVVDGGILCRFAD